MRFYSHLDTPERRRLSAPGCSFGFDPAWFRRRTRREPAVVAEDGTITLEGVKFVFQTGAVPAGTEVLISFAHIPPIYAEVKSEVEVYEEAYRKEYAEYEESERVRLNQMRDEAIAFNAQIKLPVAWVPGIKDVLSGLSQNSMGNGRNRKTVEHVLLQADLNLPRLKRKKGDFLCTTDRGKRWSDQVEEWFVDGDNQPYHPAVTCKSCIEKAERIGKGIS
jgi:hypothetical protein